MESLCFQIIVNNVRNNATVWDCDAKFEFEVKCTERGYVTIDGENYDFIMASRRVYFERHNKIMAQISIGNDTLHLRMYGSSFELTLELKKSDPVTVLILESNFHEDETKSWLMRMLTRQRYYLVKPGNIPMDRVPLLKLIAICAYCIRAFNDMESSVG